MAWKVEFSSLAQKHFDRLDPQVARRILAFLKERIEQADNPRGVGDSLKGDLGEFWKYRVGDYRVIASIEDDVLRR